MAIPICLVNDFTSTPELSLASYPRENCLRRPDNLRVMGNTLLKTPRIWVIPSSLYFSLNNVRVASLFLESF